ncbi:MAG: cyclase family protein [Phycisphaerae bacterium]|jgi:arylformamidase
MIHDISPVLGPELPVWPGDPPVTREILADMADGATTTSSALRATAHAGSHADAPSHIVAGGASIEACALTPYLGPCEVVRVSVAARTAIGPEHLPRKLAAPRVLLATGTYPAGPTFREDFAALSPELAEHLAAAGVMLVGIDTPSVDLFHAPGLPAHRALMARGISILEGLVLRDVPAGVYELIALPLKLAGFDGSPVRAVLRGTSESSQT